MTLISFLYTVGGYSICSFGYLINDQAKLELRDALEAQVCILRVALSICILPARSYSLKIGIGN